MNVKRRTGDAADLKRKHSLIYSLPLQNGMNIDVCKEMFIRTLGLKTDGMVTEFVAVKARDESSAVAPIKECRGQHEPWNKKNKVVIREHINSYHPTVSHYKLAHAPLRRYLEPGLTITGMWRDFCKKIQRFHLNCIGRYLNLRKSQLVSHPQTNVNCLFL